MYSKQLNNINIAAILPCYSTLGDNTTIINTDGSSSTTSIRIRTVINNLAKSRATDLLALKSKTAHATQGSILQPLPLAPGLVLCPIKIRKPRIAGDTSTGYINLHAVSSITKNTTKPYQSTIKLSSGITIPSLWTPATVKKHLHNAKLAIVFTAGHDTHSPELISIAQKLVEIIHDIIMLKHAD